MTPFGVTGNEKIKLETRNPGLETRFVGLETRNPGLEPRILGLYTRYSVISDTRSSLVSDRVIRLKRPSSSHVGTLTSRRSGELGALIPLDLTTAFDTVDHDILLQRLQRTFGIDGNVHRWFRSYLVGRTQYVHRGALRSLITRLLWVCRRDQF